MMIPKNKLAFFTSLFEEAKEKASEDAELFASAYQQYRGEMLLDGRPAAASRNITYELIESEVSTDIPIPKVSCYHAGEHKEKNARRIEALLSSLRDRLPFEAINDSDERMTYIYGSSLFLVEWDEASVRRGEIGTIKLTHISPTNFFPQPGVASLDGMEYCFLQFQASRDELWRSYRFSEEELGKLGEEEGDTVTTVVCFYKNASGVISRFVFSGDVVLSDLEDFYARKRFVCKDCGLDAVNCVCGGKTIAISEEYEILSENITLSDGRLLKRGTRIKRYRPKGFPLVIRKNTSFEDAVFGQSDCLFIRPQQIEINKVLSRLHEKMMMSGLYPYKPEDCQFRYDNSIGGKVLNLRPGENPNLFGVLDTSPDIAKDLAYIEATYRDAKRILGISDAYVGEGDSMSVSGKSRSIQVAQAEGRLASKRVMKNAAYAEIDRLIFEFYLAYADEPRQVIYRDGFWRDVGDAFCRYDFIVDGADGELEYDDEYHFSVDSERPLREEREALWRHNLDNYREGGFGPVAEKDTLARYWAAQVECAYPGAKKHLSYFLDYGRVGKTD